MAQETLDYVPNLQRYRPISYPLTAHFNLPHGVACAFTLPALLAFNLQADDGRISALAAEFNCGSAHELQTFILQLFVELGLVEVFLRYVPNYAAVYDLLPEMITPGRADNNLRPADLSAVRGILEATEAWIQPG